MRRAFAIVCLASIAGCASPPLAQAISGGRANQIAARTLGSALKRRGATLYRAPQPLAAAAVIAEPGPGRLQAAGTKVVNRGRATALQTPLNQRRVGRRVWLFWADLMPEGMFPHPSRLLLLDAQSGRVVIDKTMAWWPLINGKRFLPSTKPARAAVTGVSSAGGIDLRSGGLEPAANTTPEDMRASLGAITAAAPPAPGSRIIEIGDFGAPETRQNFAAWSRFAIAETGLPVIKATDASGLLAAIRDAYTEGARDVLIYVNGHQFDPGAFDLAGRAYDWANRVYTGQGPGPYVSLSSVPGPGHSWKQDILPARTLEDVIQTAKGRYRGLSVSAVVEACGSGNFARDLNGAADRYITSVGPNSFSLGPPNNGENPSPFSSAVMKAVGRVLGAGQQTSVTGALAQSEPTIAQDTPRRAADQEMRDNGSTYYAPSQQPTYDEQVTGVIVPPGPADCASDSLGKPPPRGCYRVTVQIIPSPLPSDPRNLDGLGDGVGSATLEPGGKQLSCLNPGDAAACILHADIAVNTTITVSAQPGSLVGDPATPPDSVFYQFAGSCTGTGACQLTPASSSTVVDVYFIPATATLTLQSKPASATANMTANGISTPIGGTMPRSPVYCGYSYPAKPLPCTVLARLDNKVQVEANGAGMDPLAVNPFSDNCPASTQGPSFCDVVMNGDQTVTATFQH